jgi:Fic family protein
MIHITPEIDSELAQQLAHLDGLYARLAMDTAPGSRWIGNLRRQMKARTAESSVSIEGFQVGLDRAIAILSGAEKADSEDDNQQAVVCYGRAMNHVVVMSDDPSFQWSERVLLDLHFDACYFQFTHKPGRWRTGPIYIKSGPQLLYTAPPGDEVRRLMAEVVEWLEYGDLNVHVAVRAAMAHLHVVSVHPWRDGNGRVSRIVQSLVLAREGILAPEFASIEEYLREHTAEYYAALDRAHGAEYDPTRSARDWIAFCLNAHVHLATQRLQEVEEAGRRWARCEEVVEERGWPERMVIALEQVLTGRLTNAGYREEAQVSINRAAADFRRLVDAGFITPRGAGRATHYVAAELLKRLVGPPPAASSNPGLTITVSGANQSGGSTTTATVSASPSGGRTR